MSAPAARFRPLLLLLLLLTLAACRADVDQPLPPQGEPATRARVTVSGSGLFRVEPRALAALGWQASDPLALSMGGEGVPFQQVDGALYFYLPPSTPERYSSEHALWLHYGERAGEPAPASSDAPLSSIQIEQRLTGHEQYNPKYIGDPWFWRTIVGPATERFTLETPGRQAGQLSVTVRAAGMTNTDHTLHVRVGDTRSDPLAWKGNDRFEQERTFEVPAGDSLELTIEVPEPAGGADISLLDEIIVRYPASARGLDGQLYGHSDTAGTIAIEGIAAPLAWQIAPEMAALPVVEQQLALPERSEFVVATRELAQAATLQAVETTDIETAGAQYVAIVSPSLVEAVQPLLDFHEANGLSTLLLTPQQVYDAYSHGETDPMAIQALLRAGVADWDTAPEFVLLVGDSTYDPQGYQAESPLEAYLPSPFVETVYGGETVSDNMLADLDDDGYPDVALGRLPARTAAQLTIYINKVIAYSTAPAEGAWRQRVLLAADGQEALFRNHSERLRESLPEGFQSLTIYPEAESEAVAEMLPALNEGSLVVNYVGHGSVQQWGKDQLLTAQNAGELHNGARLPIFINMTCLAGLFSHPSQESLAESLLWAPDGGAVAAIAPTSLTLPTNQSKLNEALLAELLAPEPPYLGQALDRAKRTVSLTSANDRDIVATFNLLGDPALRPALLPAAEEG